MLRLATKLIDGLAGEQELAALSDLLKQNPELHDDFVQLMQCEAALDEIHSRDQLSLELGSDDAKRLRPGDAIAGMRVLNETSTAKRVQQDKHDLGNKFFSAVRSWQLSKVPKSLTPTFAWAMAATVLLSICGYLLWPSNYAALVATENVDWADGKHYEIGDQIGSDWISLKSGVVQLAYNSSAAMTIAGPARFRATGNRGCELQLGSALAYVPPAAIGFTVVTPEMLVIDRGTSFRIEVSETRDTSLQVLEGTVEAKSSSASKTHLLVAGEVATACADQQQDLCLDSEQQLYPNTSSRIAFRAKHVPSLGHHGFKGNNRCYVFLERYGLALPHDLAVNLTDSGKHSEFDVVAGELRAGTRVDCFLVHSSPLAKRHLVEGTITFHGEILGVIGSSDKLNATNTLFGSPWLLQCQHPERGLESTPNRNSDRVEISQDRRTLRLAVKTESIDQMRVLVKTTRLEKDL